MDKFSKKYLLVMASMFGGLDIPELCEDAICKQCGKEFKREKKHNARTYCSKECYLKSREDPVIDNNTTTKEEDEDERDNDG